MEKRIKLYISVFYGYFILANFLSLPYLLLGKSISGPIVILYAVISLPMYFLVMPVLQGFYLFNIVPFILLTVKVLLFRKSNNDFFKKILIIFLFSLISGFMAYNQTVPVK